MPARIAEGIAQGEVRLYQFAVSDNKRPALVLIRNRAIRGEPAQSSYDVATALGKRVAQLSSA